LIGETTGSCESAFDDDANCFECEGGLVGESAAASVIMTAENFAGIAVAESRAIGVVLGIGASDFVISKSLAVVVEIGGVAFSGGEVADLLFFGSGIEMVGATESGK
jgi:hypothetical protein